MAVLAGFDGRRGGSKLVLDANSTLGGSKGPKLDPDRVHPRNRSPNSSEGQTRAAGVMQRLRRTDWYRHRKRKVGSWRHGEIL